MRNKLYWGLGILIVLLIGAFVLVMVNQHAKIKQGEAELKEAQELKDSINHSKSQNRPPPPGKSFEGGGHWHEDEWHDAPHPNVKSNEVSSSIDRVEEFAGIPYVRGFTSTNPLFADGVPKHLQCPKEIVGVYTTEVEDLSEIHRLTAPIAVEILTKYNPNRPLTEVWPEFIETERFYYTHADVMRSEPGEARGRIDWQFQHLLDFPEITVLQQTDSPRSSFLRQVLIGHWSPHWNRHQLPDGRFFYAGNDQKYEFIFEQTYLNSEGLPVTTSRSIGFGHAPISKQIQIKLAETTDEELQELGGWNYTIDPYTKGLYTLPSNATAQVVQELRSAIGGLK